MASDDNPSARWAPSQQSKKLVNLLYRAQDSLCFHCGKPMEPLGTDGIPQPDTCSREHIYPQATSGRGLLHNIVLAHYRCNQARGCQEPTDEQFRRAVMLYASFGRRAFLPAYGLERRPPDEASRIIDIAAKALTLVQLST
jgi:hypothetical protein